MAVIEQPAEVANARAGWLRTLGYFVGRYPLGAAGAVIVTMFVLMAIFARIEEWTKTKTKFEVMNACNAVDIPVGPILSMEELAEEQSLRQTGTIVEVDHPVRGKYLSVGNPIKLSDSITEVTRSPLLGEHTDEILSKVLKFTPAEIAEIKASGATGDMAKKAAAE